MPTVNSFPFLTDMIFARLSELLSNLYPDRQNVEHETFVPFTDKHGSFKWHVNICVNSLCLLIAHVSR